MRYYKVILTIEMFQFQSIRAEVVADDERVGAGKIRNRSGVQFPTWNKKESIKTTVMVKESGTRIILTTL